jgi:DNA-binding response OmpR family regulator
MKILIVEDDVRIAELIRRGLEEQDYEVTIANDGQAGKVLVHTLSFELVILDILLPKISGLDLCKEIRKSKPSIPIIMLTALGTTDDKVDGFDAGADDYLVKPFDLRELHVRVKALLKRNKSDAPVDYVLTLADLVIDTKTKIVKRNNMEISLTPKEFKLLEYMMRNKDRVLSRVEIAENVWETRFDTGTNFIDVYINYLRKKIDKEYSIKLIHTKPGMGFIFKD